MSAADEPSAAGSPTGSTRLSGVIGHPIRHSLSPVIFNAGYRALGLDWTYLAFDIEPGRAADAIAAMRTLDIGGYSVTMPHKEAVLACCDRLDADAEALGAVNCVVPTATDGLVGYSTDGAGFLWSLRTELDVHPSGRRVVVLGAGGAARSVVLALAGAGAAEVVVVNRSPERAEVAASLAGAVGRVGTEADVAGADLVVNGTPLGMAGVAEGDVPLGDPTLLGPGQIVADLIYHPARTPLLALAAERGATPLGGLGMLVGQAAVAFEHFTGHAAPADTMLLAARSALAARAVSPRSS